MPEDKNSRRFRGKCLAVGIAGLFALLSSKLGPIDFGRSAYNGIIGNVPILKQQLLDYSRSDVKLKNPRYSSRDVDKTLANELNYVLTDGKINPQEVSIEQLWVSCENHSQNWYERWFWPSLGEKSFYIRYHVE